MENNIYNFKYKKIENFLTNEEQVLLKNYTIINHRIGEKIKFDIQSSDCSFYADPLMESLLLTKRKKMMELTGLKLLPTYAYYRMYTFGADLKKHKDRPSCEISVTVNLTSCGEEWPIYIDGTPIYLKPGDAAIYLGCGVEHWRETFNGDHHAQAFLHYVNQEGKHQEWFKDKREIWGTQRDANIY
jgi:hypothetical protein